MYKLEICQQDTATPAQGPSSTGNKHFAKQMKLKKGYDFHNEIWATDSQTVYNISLWVTLIYHPKYNFSGVNSLQDMKQNHWTIKYRSLTYIYLKGQSDGHIDPLYQLWC